VDVVSARIDAVEHPLRRTLMLALGFGILFALAVIAGRETRVPPSQLALAWPAAAVTILWFLLVRRTVDRAVAALLVVGISGALNQLTGVAPLAAWLFGLVNLSHGLVGSTLLRRLRPAWERATWTTLGDIGALLAVAASAALTSGLLGSVLAAWRLGEPWWQGFLLISFRNAVSSFIVLNALLAMPRLWRTRRVRRPKVLLTSLVALGATAVLLALPWPVDFAIVPIVVWVALRCGPQVTALVVALQGALVVAATVAGLGQFAALASAEARVVAAQAFVLVLALVGTVLSTLEDARDSALVQSRRDRDQLQDHMEAALLASAHVVVTPTGATRVDVVNAALVDLTGRTRDQLLGSDPRTWFDGEGPGLGEGVRELTSGRALGWREQLHLAEGWGGGWVDVALALVNPDLGPSAPVEGSGVESKALTLQMIDITAQKEAERALAHAALHDELTGLANRALWTDRLERVGQPGDAAGSHAVMFVDVDHFKKVNDGYGHDVGDLVLVELAARLAGLAATDDTVARIGGDEFVLLRTGADSRFDLLAFADAILTRLSEPVVLDDGRSVSVTVSVGVADGRDGERDARQLLRRADLALYAAKEEGRGRALLWDPEVHAGIESSARLLVDLERGQAAGEFSLVFQPIVDALSGEVHAVEALLRWNHPTRGQLRPGEFLPVLEVSQLMHEVGDGALREACAYGARLAAAGRAVPVHVNVSAPELARPHLVERVADALAEADLDPSLLVVEITETQLIDVTGSLVVELFALREMGVRIAVDDFGTGFSTLTHLVDLPVDVVKLDGSFVKRMTDSRRARSVCAGVGAMARGIGIDVVAEGVETAEQHDALVALGYRYLQGFHLGRPAPAEPPAGAATAPVA
jgi:diguanylate cyclase (GGDEF)-like protein